MTTASHRPYTETGMLRTKIDELRGNRAHRHQVEYVRASLLRGIKYEHETSSSDKTTR